MKQILTLLFLCIVTIGFSQVTVEGQVTDENGDPLIAATVKAEDGSAGMVTDYDGKFSFEVPSESTPIVVSYVGYTPMTFTAGSIPSVISLTQDIAMVDEVVIVGYGTTTKRRFTGSVKQVDAEKIESKNTSDISQALAGEVSGVQVVNTNGQPGKSATVRIRGFGSALGNRSPLYVVDGLPFSGDLSSINPNDIESTTVLKDAAATAIYGNRGANGVIIVTTKKGSASDQKITVSANTGTNLRLLPEYSVITSPEQYTELGWEGLYNEAVINGSTTPGEDANSNIIGPTAIGPEYNIWDVDGDNLIDPATGQFYSNVNRKYTPENWDDYTFNNSNRSEANISFSGGGEGTTFFTSIGALRDEGYYLQSKYDRLTGRLGITHNIKPWLEGSVNLNYTTDESIETGQTSDSNSAFWFATNIPPIYPLYLRDGNGNRIPDPILGGYIYDYGESNRGFGGFTNAVGNLQYDKDEFLGNDLGGVANLRASFLKDFYAQATIRFDNEADNYTSFGNPYYGGSAPQGGSIYKREYQDKQYVFNQMVGFTKEFGDHNLDMFVSHENTDYNRSYINSYKTNLADPNNYNLNNGVVQSPTSGYDEGYTLESYFGQASYDYLGKYFATASLRNDGSSRFKNDKWGTFGSLGLAWLITEEDFMNAEWLDYLKLKASYGLVGDQAGVSFYSGDLLYSVENLDDQASLVLSGSPGNPDLTWETSKVFQTGVEFNVANRVSGTIDYFDKRTTDQYTNQTPGTSIGYTTILVNDGELQNSGLEFDFNFNILEAKEKNDFSVGLTFNGLVLNNEWIALAKDPSTGEEKVFDNNGVYGYQQGKGLFDFNLREWAGVNPDTGLPEWYVNYVDDNGNGEFDSGEQIQNQALEEFIANNPDANISQSTTSVYAQATRRFVDKSAIPDLFGGSRLNIGWNNISISANFLYGIGGYGYDNIYASLMDNDNVGSNNWHTDMLNRWQQPGDNTDVPKLTNGSAQATATGTASGSTYNSISSRFLTKADYLSLNNVNVSYDLPNTVLNDLGISGVRMYVRGDNLMLLSERDGFNPITSETGNTSSYRYTPMSTINAGLSFNF